MPMIAGITNVLQPQWSLGSKSRNVRDLAARLTTSFAAVLVSALCVQ